MNNALLKIIFGIPYAFIIGFLYNFIGFEGIVMLLLGMIYLEILTRGESNE